MGVSIWGPVYLHSMEITLNDLKEKFLRADPW